MHWKIAMIDVSEIHLKTIKGILARWVPGCEVRAFGSRVRGRAKSYSDLDLAIVCQKSVDADRLRHLREAFEESSLSFRVDVLDWNGISESFRNIIEQKYEVIQKPASAKPQSTKSGVFGNDE